MDVVQMALICGVYAEQCLNPVHLLDLAGELLRVERFCCATNPTSAIIVLLPTVNLHGFLPAFIPLSILRPCFRSLIACFKHSPRCRAAESSSSLRTLPFMMLHIICVLPLSQNGLSQNGYRSSSSCVCFFCLEPSYTTVMA